MSVDATTWYRTLRKPPPIELHDAANLLTTLLHELPPDRRAAVRSNGERFASFLASAFDTHALAVITYAAVLLQSAEPLN